MADQQVSVTRLIDAPPDKIFGVLADASLHPVIDGSGSVKGARGKPEPLHLGSTFTMNMRLGVPYIMPNTVVEFEQDELIAWAHFGKHRWRYRLVATDGGTEVTETFDWSTSRAPKVIELLRYPTRNPPNMARTLERLDAFVTNRAQAL